MGYEIGTGKYLTAMRASVVDTLLPDTCKIGKPVRAIDDAGGWQDLDPEYVTYNSSEDIPCRLDPTRQYRSGDIFGQEVIISDYNMVVPIGVDVDVDYRIYANGSEFEVRKLSAVHSWSVIKRVLMVEVRKG